MKLFRTLPTSRLIAIIAAAAIALVAGTAIAVAASGSSGPTPAPKPLAQALHDAVTANEPTGITARITFTNNLFPSGALVGQAGSALMSGATGRLWMNTNGGRLELQSDAGDVQIVWNDTKVTVYDASSNTAYTFDLPKPAAGATTSTATHATPSLDEISTFLTEVAKHWTVSGAQPSNVAGEPAYTVDVSPSHDGGLLGRAELAWDATQGVPLKVAIYAQGSSTPALALKATSISFGPVPDSDVAVAPPAGAKVVDLSSQAAGQGTGSNTTPVTGLAAVQAAVSFPVVAPDTLVGLPRQDVRLVGSKDSQAALVVYGQGLGAIVVVERAKDATGTTGGSASPLSALPAVSLNGITAHELSTQLGTVLSWDAGQVSYVLAGSLPSGAAEAAARALK
jgi:outer membrane lipoprotein-sorting protein